MHPVLDKYLRPIRDLRVSVTDRCNFRCTYCMPREVFGRDFVFLPARELLSFEEITRITRAFVGLGVEKVRLTGGEPLLRRDIEKLVAMIAALDGVKDLTLTTNGALLAKKAVVLHNAGLKRISVSLDSLDDETFKSMNDVSAPVSVVLNGIEAARASGLWPIKVNMVVKRGVNEHDVVPMARHFQGTGIIVRFIEYMDVGTSNGWQLDDVVPAAEIVASIDASMALLPIPPQYPGEVARRFSYADGSGEIGVIASVTQPFCGACTRARLAADGRLYTCLFAESGHDLRSIIRGGATDDDLVVAIAGLWKRRADRYSEERSANTTPRQKIEMSQIGG
jgi:cyclic pyranopterin phosphate synthase